jgi:Acetyltransferases
MLSRQASAGRASLQHHHLIVRSTVSTDAESIARISLECAEHLSSLDPAVYLVLWFERIGQRWGERIERVDDPAAVSLIAEYGGELVVFVDAQLDQSPVAMFRDMLLCHVTEIAACRRMQRCGIGTRILHAAEEWGRERGADMALLEFHPENAEARIFYQA